MIQRVRGTEDILDTRLLNFIIKQATKHVASYNFSHIKTPILEHTKLFQHSLGEHTDVVSKEMFVFDPDDKKSICLRPEATASTIRACHENRIVHFPWKVFSYGPMFRRERPQKGRLRQFHQFNVESIGTTSVGQDAYFMFMLNQLFEKIFKLENYVLNINYLGSPEDRAVHKEKLITFLTEHESEICKTCLERKETNTLRIFDCKKPRLPKAVSISS
jgi:histidyl-tRNA synthetase